MTSREPHRADKDADASGGRRVSTRVPELSALVGAHPDALRAIFGAGRATDPAELGAAPRGRFLAVGDGAAFFLLTRPIVRLFGSGLNPWEGKIFDHGGNSGKNVLFGRQVIRFHVETGPSALDGKPALLLSYGEAAYNNPWPIRAIVDELRTIGDGIAIGPALFYGGGASPRLLLWFGLE